MTKEQLAEQLNGREYRDELTYDLKKAAKEHDLVVVYGASDDLMEFNGAIYDEFGCYDGGTALIDIKGVLPNRDEFDVRDFTDQQAAAYFQRRLAGRTIEAVWDNDGYSWTYKTEIPHATFEIMDAGDKYCRGIVFALADL